jgi:hypothetical protein
MSNLSNRQFHSNLLASGAILTVGSQIDYLGRRPAGARVPARAARYSSSLAGIAFEAWHCSAPLGASAKAVRLARKRFPRATAAIGSVRTPCRDRQAICKKEAFKRAEKELAAIRTIWRRAGL